MSADRVSVTRQPDGTALIRLPYVDYLDTQAGPVEIGLDDELLRQLHEALSGHLAAEEPRDPNEPEGGWGPNPDYKCFTAQHDLCPAGAEGGCTCSCHVKA